jgi:NADH-quinone oxidoreductase subunit M
MSGPVNESIPVFTDLLWNEKAVLISIALLIFIFGLYPAPILELTQPAIDNLLK